MIAIPWHMSNTQWFSVSQCKLYLLRSLLWIDWFKMLWISKMFQIGIMLLKIGFIMHLLESDVKSLKEQNALQSTMILNDFEKRINIDKMLGEPRKQQYLTSIAFKVKFLNSDNTSVWACQQHHCVTYFVECSCHYRNHSQYTVFLPTLFQLAILQKMVWTLFDKICQCCQLIPWFVFGPANLRFRITQWQIHQRMVLFESFS